MPELHAGRLIARSLAANGADLAFGVPGESFLPLLDGLKDEGLRFVAARHEAGAGHMAVALAKLTGRAGVAMVSRGPGATHASIAVHTAMQDSAPMILLVGQIARADRDREAFQEIDYRRFFAPIAKWVAEIDAADRVPEYVARAFSLALSGRPGPVVLSLPEDMLAEPASAAPIAAAIPAPPAPEPDALARALALLQQAKRPLALIGRIGWDERARTALMAFAERSGLPVACAFRAKDQFPNQHPNYVGDLGLGPNPALADYAARADVILALGLRLDEATTGYGWLAPGAPMQALIHVVPAAELLGAVHTPAVALAAGPAPFCGALQGASIPVGRWEPHRAALAEALRAWTTPVAVSGQVNPSELFATLRGRLASDAIVTNGAGNFAAWLHRFFPHHERGTQAAPISGAMGFGVPAAVAAKIAFPTRQVICVAGDGDFLMSAQELATARAIGAAPVVIVLDNAAYGTIRMHQERLFPGRPVGVGLWSPDFAAMARAYGMAGATVEETAQFGPALEEALAHPAGGLLHVRMSAADIAPGRTIADLDRSDTQ